MSAGAFDPSDSAGSADFGGSTEQAARQVVGGAAAAIEGEAAGSAVCAVCRSALAGEEPQTACPACQTVYHQACWDYVSGCSMYGCPQTPPTEGLEAIEIPAGWWGQPEKDCPACGQKILAAALRCRFCGTTFASAQPETQREFQQRASVHANLAGVRSWSVVFLILGILPCSAPLAAVFGSVWYACWRREIAALPAMHGALCKIGLLVAVAQTVLFVVIGILFTIFRA